jgi:hypothetical protein
LRPICNPTLLSPYQIAERENTWVEMSAREYTHAGKTT